MAGSSKGTLNEVDLLLWTKLKWKVNHLASSVFLDSESRNTSTGLLVERGQLQTFVLQNYFRSVFGQRNGLTTDSTLSSTATSTATATAMVPCAQLLSSTLFCGS